MWLPVLINRDDNLHVLHFIPHKHTICNLTYLNCFVKWLVFTYVFKIAWKIQYFMRNMDCLPIVLVRISEIGVCLLYMVNKIETSHLWLICSYCGHISRICGVPMATSTISTFIFQWNRVWLSCVPCWTWLVRTGQFFQIVATPTIKLLQITVNKNNRKINLFIQMAFSFLLYIATMVHLGC